MSHVDFASAVLVVGSLVFGAGLFSVGMTPALVLVALVGGVAALAHWANRREAFTNGSWR